MISIDTTLSLSPVTMADVPQLVQYLNNEKIYRNTLKIPFPYTRADAGWFVHFTEGRRQQFGRQVDWAIRNGEGYLIGGVGFHVRYGLASHKDEIGYWLGEPFWGQGIMTRVIAEICRLGFQEFNLLRLEASVFEHNQASGRVLEKNGFVAEGILKNHFLKNGRPITVKLYAKTRSMPSSTPPTFP
ncbi:MAG: GNAT family N-acetyltransferase [Ferruginibacter sp.]|nr:GNAT family N-acetyltransferase [Cytophagales bacterium]